MDAVNRDRRIAGAGTPAEAWRNDAALAGVPAIDPAGLLGTASRVVVVAPHPDDEILSCGGLLAQYGGPLLLVAVTDGEGSHPGSPAWPVDRLRGTRPQESLAALRSLGIAAPAFLRLGIADGGVSAAEGMLCARLQGIIGPADLVITTWRYDGHPDHEATARACAAAATRCGARLLEVPVWGWHWSAPGDGAMPLASARRLDLDAAIVARKRAAMLCFDSQLAVDESTGAAPILPGHALERALQPFELYLHGHP
ncbi:LmbE family N-acetylglucosaminyl deacetylase [Pseudoduganella lurida]|uniref:LmbE family N-acetylglucosaminyl deacetylase n=1 Tax=Pseudoduganella lurida TaxID=1036180 RepID=A0A562RL42_9BURK|nr:PIG-L family deacetylase [Pseudoduganella lurida]TWI69765.1 LmbE family N-acetylglucosaminyl deacetylase [Pseudoduganella lurida]